MDSTNLERDGRQDIPMSQITLKQLQYWTLYYFHIPTMHEYSQPGWWFWGSSAGSSILSLGILCCPRLQRVSDPGSGNYWLSAASPGYADQSEGS